MFSFFYTKSMHLKDELQARWFLKQFTHDELFDIYEKGWQTLYFGCDPTADSLHLGHFVVFMNAVQFMKKNNKLVLIVGGATGMIGDPGGKDSERQFLDMSTLQKNVDAIKAQVSWVLKHLQKLTGIDFSFEVVNNYEFYENMNVLEFLRDVGKHITVNQMMHKETVKRRLFEPDKYISYTEFSYMLLQGYDFVKLYKEKGVKLQICWSDQRWNVVTGVELIKKMLDQEAYGITSPLLLDSNGKKFGKSEGNAIWLDPKKSSPYSVFQYFMNTPDEDIWRFMKILTLLDLDTIDKIVAEHSKNPQSRYGQQQLATYVVTTIFGEIAAKQAATISSILFGWQNIVNLLSTMSTDELNALYLETGGVSISQFPAIILDIMIECGLVDSRGEWKKAIEAGSITLNDEKVTDTQKNIEKKDLIEGKVALLKKGKKNVKTLLCD